ncbi:hypothetical protein LINGRAHAP2_LOCUS30692 [Linum grandiflorum]
MIWRGSGAFDLVRFKFMKQDMGFSNSSSPLKRRKIQCSRTNRGVIRITSSTSFLGNLPPRM